MPEPMSNEDINTLMASARSVRSARADAFMRDILTALDIDHKTAHIEGGPDLPYVKTYVEHEGRILEITVRDRTPR